MNSSRAALLALSVLATGCGSGRLVISLERPTIPALDPLGDVRLSKFSLRVTQGGTATDQDVFRGGGQELLVGSVPVDRPFDLRLAGKTAADDMLGLGLVLDVEASGSSETSVAVNFRKPMGYVAGGDRVIVLNTVAATAVDVEPSLLPLDGAGEVASTPNGVLLLVVVGKSLFPVRTADHAALAPVALPATGTCLGVNGDSRYAVVCHRGEQSVSIVELGFVGTGQVKVSTVKLGSEPTRVALGGDRRTAWVLSGGISESCDQSPPESQLAQVDLPTAKIVWQPPGLGASVSDVAVDPRDDALLLALPCEDTGVLRRVSVSGGTADRVAEVPSPYDIAVTEQSLVVMGASGDGSLANPIKGQAVIFDLTKPGFSASPQTRSFLLPPLGVDLSGDTASAQGSFNWLSMPTKLRVYELSVAPDGRRAIALFEAEYASKLSVGGNACHFETHIIGDGYLLVDLVTGSLLTSQLTKLVVDPCVADCVTNMKNNCAPVFKSIIWGANPPAEFKPSSSTLLFGGT
jgi:hypothetical protein